MSSNVTAPKMGGVSDSVFRIPMSPGRKMWVSPIPSPRGKCGCLRFPMILHHQISHQARLHFSSSTSIRRPRFKPWPPKRHVSAGPREEVGPVTWIIYRRLAGPGDRLALRTGRLPRSDAGLVGKTLRLAAGTAARTGGCVATGAYEHRGLLPEPLFLRMRVSMVKTVE